MEAYLILEDGTIFQGEALEAGYFCHGEVVFNTSMTGYQEILTDPSYCGQIVVLTYPLIGNYGINEEDREAPRPQVLGLVVREACLEPSNWRAQETLASYLKRYRIPVIQGVDTRALTRHLRTRGTMRGILTSGQVDWEEVKRLVRQTPPLSGDKLVPAVTNSQPYVLGEGSPRIAVYNLGVKQSILEWFIKQGCSVTVFPAHSTAEDILAIQPDGVLLSNGPGDPKDVPYGVETVKGLLGKVPILGICLGHQILALALGGDTFKLHFGHRGGNHPVKDLTTGRVYITSQNHGYAVAAGSLPSEEVYVSHINLNDDTVEGLRHRYLPVFSVQYHPEAGPGPRDSEYIFREFLELISNKGCRKG
ncbi:carbamoyl-phosphate synthase small subunit [Thermanaeromonas toyohensis ToBE]|uniref:Carbamoyl phosphate synthase small chain n=1 Tax=Thermanaeromonas toyohensis ToBE TaxID=698762 RepID=A0A1W1VMH9_9FIRM|nr:glutamine-hydrolyzing carbamoyl-phosphate synthase small subunit [Thermanaeromonas toyohensis]SMB94528.1 carbamoyl-phosphate synthase small subunit [Thermanaeromonas toyohensis ToBE]